MWRPDDPQGGESLKIRWEIVPFTRGKVLDIGCGPVKPFEHFIGLDNNADAGLFGIQARPNIWIKDARDLAQFASAQYDSVFSSHLLEHIEYADVPAALKEWWRLIKVGGYLVLYLPDEDQYPKVGETHANPDHKWNVNFDRVLQAMRKIGGWDLIEFQKRDQGQEYSLFFVFRKIHGDKQRQGWKTPKPEKTVAVIRYGAFGDLMQASSIFAGLKAQGYHVTLYSTLPGAAVIENDPNIDQVILQDKDQVPNHELGAFWKYIGQKYDRVVNLSESVEGTLLALPGRIQHGWHPMLRHRMLDHNYLEFQHDIAQVPHKPQIRFFASDDEKKWARRERAKMGTFTVLWVLAGSSVHKTWPYVDNVVAALMQAHPGIHVVFCGGPVEKMLEAGWENEPRVHKTCGVWSIRETLAFLDQADAVIGPETGVLNAASCLSIPKIVFLSHSTHQNLTRDWVNVYPLAAETLTCKGRGENEAPACHQLHYSWDNCNREEAGVASCQAAIPADRVTDILNVILDAHFKKAA